MLTKCPVAFPHLFQNQCQLTFQVQWIRTGEDPAKMKVLAIGLLTYAIASTLTIILLGTLLTKCKSSISADKIEGDKTSVEKEEYGIFVLDNGQEGTCQCDEGIAAVGWTILEIIVTAVLGVMILIMLVKGVIMGAIAMKERRMRKIIEEEERQEQLRERIRMEERSKCMEANEETSVGIDNLK